MDKTYVSKDGFEKLVGELEYLKTTRRREIAQQLEFARSFGDLRENSEYEAAKHALSLNEIRIRELEEKVAKAEIIAAPSGTIDKIIIGAKVKVWDIDYEEEVDYELTGVEEADPVNNKISIESPVGKALLGKTVNDVVEVRAPRSVLKYKILSISA